MENMANVSGGASESSASNSKVIKAGPVEFAYKERDVILYNLGIGAKREELPYVYENSSDFQAIPSFGVIPAFPLMFNFPMQEAVGDFNPMMLLHGEQFLELFKPIPTSGTLINEAKVVDVVDKGKGTLLIIGVTTKDASGQKICYNEYTNFIRGVSGKGSKKGKDRGAATALNNPPSRQPDSFIEEKTNENQAAIYRLAGDLNPLHIDPEMSKMGGFDVPILHGLCTFGYATKHVVEKYLNRDGKRVKSIKARFAKHVFPGETLRTEMWKEGEKIYFQVRVVERDVLAITNAAVELRPQGSKL
jgi:acyl dehydratase